MTIQAVARQFAAADDRRAWAELGGTLAVYAAGLCTALANAGVWPVMLPAMGVAALAGLRLYVIQHDCFHRSFFTARERNDRVGTLLSPITMTPFQATRHIHTLHHSHVSDLDRRDTFEIFTMTLAEWEAASWGRRMLYRIYRSPLVLIVLGPFVLFTVLRRAPLCAAKTGIGDVLLHNALLAAYWTLIGALAGWAGLAVLLGAIYIASVLGALISYVVHNFEQVHYGVKPELDFQTAALEGSSVLDWGAAFHLATMNIGFHDLHHLNARIPGYRLKAAHEALEAQGLIRSVKIGMIDGLRCLRWKLYDQAQGRMIPFPPRRSRGVGAIGEAAAG